MCFRDHSLKLLISYLTLNALVSFSVNGDNNKVIIRFELVHICGVLKIVSSTFLWLSSQSYRNRDFSKCLLYNSIKIKKIFILISAKLRASCKRYPSPCKWWALGPKLGDFDDFILMDILMSAFSFQFCISICLLKSEVQYYPQDKGYPEEMDSKRLQLMLAHDIPKCSPAWLRSSGSWPCL